MSGVIGENGIKWSENVIGLNVIGLNVIGLNGVQPQSPTAASLIADNGSERAQPFEHDEWTCPHQLALATRGNER
eukprot:4923475-Pleurochrysis_carterae.AAC.1